MNHILTVTTNPTVDLSSSVENVFPDHKLRCGAVQTDPGGGGINVARVIKRLGGDTVAWYCGGGPIGAVLESLLRAEGVPQESIPIAGSTRQSFTVLETSSGQQYRFVMPGPTVSETEWEDLLDRLTAEPRLSDWVVASGSLAPGIPDDFYARLARIVRSRGGRLILDTSGAPLIASLEEGVYMIKPSLRELRSLTHSELAHESEQEEAALRLVKSGKCEVVVVSLAAAGVLLATRSGCQWFRSPTVAVRSRVGAGDSMVAGIALSLAHYRELPDAVRFGIAAGAAAVMNPGTELCHRDVVERLYRDTPAQTYESKGGIGPRK